MKIAVIDIGTNSIHMLMADILPNFTFEVLGREKEMARLGDGTLGIGYLSDEVMERGLFTLKKFVHLAKTKGIRKIIAVATSAVREAHNGGDFIRLVYKQTGLKVRVITGEEEGRLIYLGVKHSMDLKKENSLIVDIGGGSVEIMVVNPKKIHFLVSLKMGAARLKELFFRSGTAKENERLEKYVTALVQQIAPAIGKLGFIQAIGTSGTLNNLAAMAAARKEEGSQPAPRNGGLSFEEMKELYKALVKSTPEERAKMKGLDSRRNDLITSGAAAAFIIMKTLGIEILLVSDAAIREGMIYDYIERNRTKITREISIPNVRRRSVLKLARKCRNEKEHSEQVARLALQIYDRTQVLHNFGPTERELLEYTAFLHDIGYHISYEKHHHHAYYLIKNVVMNGFTEEEIDILSLSVRYHRGSGPKKAHAEFSILGKTAKKRVEWLSAILRIADALDRTHFGVVDGVGIKIKKKALTFILSAKNDAEYEIWEARRKSDLLEKVIHREVGFALKKISGRRKISALSA